jgi:tripartite-type tricarboxylate transporter receptor subunit TctC
LHETAVHAGATVCPLIAAMPPDHDPGQHWEDAMTRLVAAAALAAVLGLTCPAIAQDYPTRPITVVVPFPAGGPTDTLARILGERMRASLGQPFIIENVTGAGASIGVTRAIQSPPDGYTLSIGNWTSHVGAGAMYPVAWDVLKDLAPISLLTATPLIIVGKNALPARNGGELIAWLRANPDKASTATVGAGSAAHICALYFEQQTGTRFQMVPYRGGAPAMQDMIAGQIDLMCAEASQTLGFVRNGQMKAFAVMAKERWPALPDVPTTDEIGAPGMYISFWHGLWAPKGTPQDVIAKLDAAVVEALADAAVRKRLTDLGVVIAKPEEQNPAALAAFHKAEIAKWWPIIKGADIKAN